MEQIGVTSLPTDQMAFGLAQCISFEKFKSEFGLFCCQSLASRETYSGFKCEDKY